LGSKLPGVSAETKAKYLPIHVTAGLLMVTLPVITVATGYQEKTEFQDRFGMHDDGRDSKDCNDDGKEGKDFSGPCHKLAAGSSMFKDMHAKELVLLNWVRARRPALARAAPWPCRRPRTLSLFYTNPCQANTPEHAPAGPPPAGVRLPRAAAHPAGIRPGPHRPGERIA
jgi:hypothetical protein